MSRHYFQRKPVIGLLLVVLLGLTWMSCSSSVKERRPDAPPGGDLAVGRYYFFDDVLVPKELNYQANDSFVYETPQFKAGSMVFSKWWLDARSVIDFFTYHMEKDNWKLVNSFQGRETILNFSKPDKSCTIKIWETWYGSLGTEIRVGPLGMKKM
jgi:hypothetical protein